MSIFMDTFLERHPGAKYLFIEDDNVKASNRLKQVYSKALWEEVWCTPEFINLTPKSVPLSACGWPTDIGTHSSWKCPAD